MNTFKRKILCFYLVVFLSGSLPALNIAEQAIYDQMASRALLGLIVATILYLHEFNWKYWVPLMLIATPCSRTFLFCHEP